MTKRTPKTLVLLCGLAAVAAGFASEAKAQVIVASAEYQPMFYDGCVVYYDDWGRPFIYVDGVAVYIPTSYALYSNYVSHYRVHRARYHSWYRTRGLHFRHYRQPGYIHRGPAVNHRGPAPSHRGPAMNHRGPDPSHRGPAMNHRGPAPSHRGPAVNHQGPAPSHRGPAVNRRGPAPSHRGPAVNHRGPAPSPRGPAMNHRGPATRTTVVTTRTPSRSSGGRPARDSRSRGR